MRSFFITFGQSHIHQINGKIFNKDCVCEIIAESSTKAREIAFENFGPKWAFQYNSIKEVGLHYYNRGIITLN